MECGAGRASSCRSWLRHARPLHQWFCVLRGQLDWMHCDSVRRRLRVRALAHQMPPPAAGRRGAPRGAGPLGVALARRQARAPNQASVFECLHREPSADSRGHHFQGCENSVYASSRADSSCPGLLHKLSFFQPDSRTSRGRPSKLRMPTQGHRMFAVFPIFLAPFVQNGVRVSLALYS